MRLPVALFFIVTSKFFLVSVVSLNQPTGGRPAYLTRWNKNPTLSLSSGLAMVGVTTDSAIPTERNKEESWITPRLHNTAAFRSLALLGAISAAGFSSNSPLVYLSSQGTAALHLFSFSTWFGTMMYTTFILGITMFKNLPRKTFGKLQAKLFPMYFSLSSVTIILQLITLKAVTPQAAVTNTVASSTKALVVALVMTLLNQFMLEPLATDNMMRRYELEETSEGTSTDDYKKLKKNFGKLHGFSSLTNLVALCAAAFHGFFLSAAFV